MSKPSARAQLKALDIRRQIQESTEDEVDTTAAKDVAATVWKVNSSKAQTRSAAPEKQRPSMHFDYGTPAVVEDGEYSPW